MRKILAAIGALALAGCAYTGSHYAPASPSSHGAEATTSSHCGVERWAVKTGTDPGASSVQLSPPMPATVDSLVHFLPPGPHDANTRVFPVETTDYTLKATLKQYKIEDDQDIHMVIEDAFGNHMIAELPSPSCVGSSSPWISLITNARNAFDNQFHPTTSWKTYGHPITLTGVGFFDDVHGQTGVAGGPGITTSNGIELHPVLGWTLGG